MDIEEIVALSVKHNASDLHLCSGQPGRWRVNGQLQSIEQQTPDPQLLVEQWLSAVQQAELESTGQQDCAVSLANGIRLRAHFFLQRHGLALALRIIKQMPPSLAQLATPAVVPALITETNGLMLVTGATGSGKSTTLAAMIDFLNQHFALHVVTLEDPIEYLHASQRCLIQQREAGNHCRAFHEGLRAALREDPDVILLGELRDIETIRLALTAAETGHLVLATLHARSATQAIDRLVDVFPAEEKNVVRTQLAGSLRAVLAQKLVADNQNGRVALYELLVNTPAVSNLIREGKTHQLPGLLQTGLSAGMQTFTQSEQQLIAQGRLSLPVNHAAQTSFPE